MLKSSEDERPQGTRIGRFTVLRTLGEGGMGVVYAVYDPELDRTVALKFIHPAHDRDRTARGRLSREAQALAKLNHPNVVAVHDVGTHRGRLWLSMELVVGTTLREWLAAERRGWRDVLEVMKQVARGVAAAHKAGVLHRDLKPENIMVGDDGRVRVMDFGLACAGYGDLSAETDPSPLRASFAVELTAVGAIMGTPAYMAPEQLEGGDVDERTDQFSLCATLWEALYGERPYQGETMDAIAAAVGAGELRRPARASVPGWLRRCVERGLNVDPERRYADVDELIAALSADPTPRRRLVGLGVALALGVGGTAAANHLQVERAVAACEATGDQVAEVWSDSRRAALRNGLLSTGVVFAEATAERVDALLTTRAEAWRAARVESCLDGHVRDTWDRDTLDRAVWCLDARQMEFDELVDELSRGDAVAVQNAVGAAASLPRVATCRSELRLEATPIPPRERDRVRSIRQTLSRADAQRVAGNLEQALETAREAQTAAEALDWEPLVAVTRQLTGVTLLALGRYAEAETALEDAYFRAARSGALEVAAKAANSLTMVVGHKQSRHVDGLRWYRHADATLAALAEEAESPLRADSLDALASVHVSQGEFKLALPHLEASLAIRERVFGEAHPQVGASLNNLANVQDTLGAQDEARALHRRALAIAMNTVGADHPDVATALDNLGVVQVSSGALDEGAVLHQRALAIREKALGPAHPDVAHALMNLAVAHGHRHDYEAAVPLLQRALAIREGALGVDHPAVAEVLGNLAAMHQADGDKVKARAMSLRVLKLREKTLGPSHPSVATVLHNLALLNAAQGELEEAAAQHRRALVIRENTFGPEHPAVAASLDTLAALHRRTGALEEAESLAARAVELREKALGPEHLDLAASLTTLALIRQDAGDHAESRRLFERALDIRESAVGPEHPLVAASLNDLGGALRLSGALDEAQALHERSQAIHEAAKGRDHVFVSYALVGLVEVALQRGRPAEVVAIAERAARLRKADRPVARAEALLLLARVLWSAPPKAGRDRARALELARQAHDLLRDERGWERERKKIETFLAKRS